MLLENKLLQIKNLKKYYSLENKTIKAVNDVSFDIFDKETVGLVGESGCGKSTISKLIVNLINPTSGDILFENNSIFSKKSDRFYLAKNLQIIFQDPYFSLNPRMTVQDIISEPLKIHKIIEKNQIQNHVDSLLEQVNLSPSIKNRFAHEFSSGQRQRIGIARALSLHPKFIVCDEPISSLDLSIQAQIVNLLKELQNKYNLTFLFISHDIAMVRYISNRIVVMYLGEIMEIAKSEEIIKKPLHPYTQALFDSVPTLIKKEKKRSVKLLGDISSDSSETNGCLFYPRCPYRKKICLNEKPLFKKLSEEHFIKCHLYN